MADFSAQVAQEWLSTMFSHCGLSVGIQTNLPDAALTRLKQFGGHWLTLDEGNLSAGQKEILIANKGEILDAIQYLVNATLNLGQDAASQAAYTVELSGFREQRYLKLAQIAEDVAQTVRQTGQEIVMEPLPPAERRLIHTLLGESADLETYSRGQEPQRCLVVGPKLAQVVDS